MENIEFDLKIGQNVKLLKGDGDFMVFKLGYDGKGIDYLLWDYGEKYNWYNREQIEIPKRKSKIGFKISNASKK